jgi:DNA-binding response OmpR family regulator
MKWGASDYIVKPFDLDKLNASIRTALETKPAAKEPSAEMNAIARGVEAKLDPFSAFSKMVTQRTADIARQLGVAEKEIQKWATAKATLDSERNRIIKSSPDEPE